VTGSKLKLHNSRRQAPNDDLLILYSDSAIADVDAFEALINQSFDATPREPVDQYLALREKVWSAHGKLIHLAIWGRPDIAHAVSVLGRDWGADLDNRRSTGAHVIFLDGAGVSWRVKLSSTVCLSTQEAEYCAQTEGVKEILNIRMLLRDLGFGLSKPTRLFCDNQGAITMSLHPANKPATRHMEMKTHFCRQHTELGNTKPIFKPTPKMVADFMTKQTARPTHVRHALRTFGNQDAPVALAPIQHLVE